MAQNDVARNITSMLLTSGERDTSAVENEIVSAHTKFFIQRFSIDEQRLSIVKPYVNLMLEADLKAVHSVISSDLNMETLGLQYDELNNMEDVQIQVLRTASLREKVKLLAQSEHYTVQSIQCQHEYSRQNRTVPTSNVWSVTATF